MKTRELAAAALLAAVMAVCAWITVPAPVPFTMQTFAIFLAVGVLGGKGGTLAVGVYLLLGAVGAPVLSGFSGGLGSFLGATGGYLIGFLLIALVMWGGERLLGQSRAAFFLFGLLGLAVCYGFGTAWFLLLYTARNGPVELWTVLGWCVFPFLLPDLVKLALAYSLSCRLRRALKRP